MPLQSQLGRREHLPGGERAKMAWLSSEDSRRPGADHEAAFAPREHIARGILVLAVMAEVVHANVDRRSHKVLRGPAPRRRFAIFAGRRQYPAAALRQSCIAAARYRQNPVVRLKVSKGGGRR